MPLTNVQKIIHVMGVDIVNARKNLSKQLDDLPDVRIVSISAYVIGGVGNGIGGMINLVAVVEEI